MVDIAISNQFLDIITVLLSVGIGVIAKLAMRRDVDRKTWKNDLAVGLDLLIATAVLVVTRSADHFIEINQPEIEESIRIRLNDVAIGRMMLLLIITMGIFGVATLTRMVGWRNKGKLDFVKGVALPNIIGAFVLWYVSDSL